MTDMEKSPEKTADEQARELIRNSLNENYFVEASAGSGKTTILVDRMVNMVKAGTDISKICAITFTKAAANEFYGRFKKKLEEESGKGDIRCRDAAASIDLCFMGTIDSFCQTVLCEHPTAAGISVNSSIIGDAEEESFYKRFFTDIQNGRHGDELRRKSIRFRLLNSDAENSFASMMCMLANRRNADIIHADAPWTPLDELFREEKEKCVSVLRVLYENREYIKKEKGSANVGSWEYLTVHFPVFANLSWERSTPSVVDMLYKAKDICVKKETDIEQLFGLNCGVFRAYESRGRTAWYEIAGFLEGIAEKIENCRFSFCQSFVCECLETACGERRSAGKLTFFDYQLYLAQMLEKDARSGGALIRHIYARHSYFLLDEFQDTDPIQAKIFFYLSARTLDADWRKCIPHKGSLFIVGDPKQSIYRFRSADVTSYQNVRKLFTGDVGRTVVLSCNFRSTLELCEYFNNTFKGLMPEDSENQSRYNPIPYDGKENGEDCFGGVFSYQKAPDQPEQVLDIVRTLTGNPAYMIYDVKEKRRREIEYRDFMVITYGKSSLSGYATAFSKSGIPFYIEGTSGFDKCPALVNLVKIYSAAANPNDRKRLAEALCCDVYGVDAGALAQYISAGNDLSLYGCAESAFSEAVSELGGLVNESHSVSPAALFSSIIDRTALIESSGVERIEYLYFALELVREKTATMEIDSVAACSEYLEQLLKSSDEERCLSLCRDINSVHFANLHKVKGLEAPVVILAASKIRARSPVIRVDYSAERPECYCFSVVKNRSKLLRNHQFAEQQEAEQISLDAERIRLLYVAATRARNALVIGYDAAGGGSPRSDNVWLPFIENRMPEQVPCSSCAAGEPAADSSAPGLHELFEEGRTNALTDSTSKEKSYEIRLPSKIKLNSVTRPDELNDSEEMAEEKKKKRNPALVGTVVHRLMELLVNSKGKISTEDAVRDICLDYDADDPYYRDILLGVAQRMRSGGYEQENGGIPDILSELYSADEVFCELPFCRRAGEKEIWHGVMDAVYRKGENWYIVDYKTNSEAEDLDFKYQSQLASYTEAFREITGCEAAARIYHIDV